MPVFFLKIFNLENHATVLFFQWKRRKSMTPLKFKRVAYFSIFLNMFYIHDISGKVKVATIFPDLNIHLNIEQMH